MIIIEIILLLWLLAMSIIDIRKGSFSGKYLFFALVFFSVAIGILCFLNLKDWKCVVSGGAAGSVFLIASNVTQGAIGLGDGYILTICGIVMGLYQVMVLIIFALCLVSAFGILLWVRKKAGRHTKIPFAPFICAGYGVIFICSIL